MAGRPMPGTRTRRPYGVWREDGWWTSGSGGWVGPYEDPDVYMRQFVRGGRIMLRLAGRIALACLAILVLMVACGLCAGTR